MTDIYIIGAGGFGREVLWLIREINKVAPTWNVKGFIDDNPELQGKSLCGVKVVGSLSYLAGLHGTSVVLAVGSPKAKAAILDQLSNYALEYPTLVSPFAHLSEYVHIGRGCIICHGSILTTQISLGEFVTVNLSCTIGHDVVIGDGVTLSPACNVSGNAAIGAYTDIGTNSSIIPGVVVGSHVTVGAGAVLIRDVPSGATVVGNPGRVLGR